MWTKVAERKPIEGVIVDTKVDDGNGKPRNEAKLIFRFGMWWHSDGKMYVYYTPTHWKDLNDWG